MLLGNVGVYLIGGTIGALAFGPFLLMLARGSSSDDAHAIQRYGFIGSVAGGFLGVAVIGPVGQLMWRVITDIIVADPDLSGNYLWPAPVSLWYPALVFGALAGGLYVGLFAALVAKRRTSRNRV